MIKLKLHYITILMLLFNSFVPGQIDTIPTRFYGVAENESYTYISTNTGLYILERDSNNIFGEIHNVKDSLKLLYIHNNYLLSGDENRLKIFDIIEPTNPYLILDTLINYPIADFENFHHYFILRLHIDSYKYKFLLTDIIGDELLFVFDSDSANPSLSNFSSGSEFYYPYAFINFNSYPYDTLRTYRYDYTQNIFYRLSKNFIFYQYFISAGAYNNLLFTAYTYDNIYGEPVFEQDTYSIDTISNTFTHISWYNYFGKSPEDVNSFAVVTAWQPAWKYDFSEYKANSWPNPFTIRNILTDDNLYRTYQFGQGPESIEYSFRVTEDSIIYKLIDFNPTTISEYNTELNEFNLSLNYPNPFNPTTKINYLIPELSYVTLRIYDVLGNEIGMLVNEEKPSGSYEVEFSAKGGSASGGDAYDLPSGIYFYRIRAGNYIETKKMILIK